MRKKQTPVAVLQDFGNTLVELGLLRHWFVWTTEIQEIESGCTCGYCRHSRIVYGISYVTVDGEYHEDEINL